MNETWMGECLTYGFFGDFMENNALGFFKAYQFLNMPGNSFALAVGVGCKKYFARSRGGFAEFRNDLFLCLYCFIVWYKTAGDIYRFFVIFWEIANVANRCHNHEFAVQIFCNRLRLCGR